jgi:Tol biopolymer transport system component
MRFEDRLHDAFGRYVAAAPVDVDASHVAAAAAIAARAARHGASLPWMRSNVRPALRIAFVVLVLLALVVAALIAGSRRQVVPTGDPSLDGPIAVYAGSAYYSIALDGRPTRMPIDAATDTGCPTYSPDGRSLAFHLYNGEAVSHELAVADPDGTNLRVLWDGDMSNSFHQVRWSADGSTVMLNGAIAGGRARTVFGNPASNDAEVSAQWGGELPGSFALSPNGQRIAVIASETDGGPTGIVIRDRVGRVLSFIAAAPGVTDIAWSPSGLTIAYAAPRSGSEISDLHFVNDDGSDDRIVQRGSTDRGFGFMAWSPDGKTLAAIDHAQGAFFLQLLSDSGAALGRLGPFDQTPNLSFTWAPGGDAVVFTTAGKPRLGLGGGPPLIAWLDGRTQSLAVPAGYYTACPLGWGRAVTAPTPTSTAPAPFPSPTPFAPIEGVAPTPRFTPEPNPPAQEALVLRTNPVDPSTTDVVAVRPDGQERLLQRVSTGVLGDQTFGPYGSVAANGWLAVGVASSDPSLGAYRLLDLADPNRAPIELSYPAVIGGRWSLDGRFARSSMQDRSPTGWMKIAVLNPRTGADVELGKVNLFGGGPSIVWTGDGSGILNGGLIRPIDGSPNVPIHPDLTFLDRRVGAGGIAIELVCPGPLDCSSVTGASVLLQDLGKGTSSTWTFDLDSGEVPTSALFTRDGRSLLLTLVSTDPTSHRLTIARLGGSGDALERLITVDVPDDALMTNGYAPMLNAISPDDRAFLVSYWIGQLPEPTGRQLLVTLGNPTAREPTGQFIGFLPEPLAESLLALSP